MNPDPTCPHVALLWRRCESMSALCWSSTDWRRFCCVLFLFQSTQVESPRRVLSWWNPLHWNTKAWCKVNTMLKSSDDNYIAVVGHRETHVLFRPLPTSLAVWLTLSCLLGSFLWSCGLGKRDNSGFSSVLCIFPFHLLCLCFTQTHTYIYVL